jgi:predicted nucleic acid-binding protein
LGSRNQAFGTKKSSLMPGHRSPPQIHLDANAILRFLRFDIPSQANAVESRLVQARSGALIIHIHPLVLAEVVFVLESNWSPTTPSQDKKLLRI